MKKYQIILLILPFMLAGACSQDAPTVQSPPSPALSLEEAAVDEAPADEPPDATASTGFPSNEKQYGLLEDERSVMTTPEGEIGLPVEPPWPSYKEYQVVVNCYAVRDAAERFAADNNGAYPSNLADATPVGDTVIDLLPGGTLLRNPYTFANTEPVDGAAAVPGQTGYLVHVDHTGKNVGYTIDGRGRDRLIITITAGTVGR